MDQKKVMLSGIQPSGDLHLGNYLGAIKNWVERTDEFDNYYFMADLHTITVRQTPADLRRRTLEQLAQYIACGIDAEKNLKNCIIHKYIAYICNYKKQSYGNCFRYK